ncbi:hypothetical protein LNN30_13040, partial [Escherichia fergusonii]|nr:hypothetical protein [Escherichia fergusonii]MCC8288152.1 hypothetical protein [Escherichia fergusonii]MCC8317103.1 hypothetical protein [Escherichia fergusonii]
ARHQIKQKAILTDGLFALVQKIMPGATLARLILPHKPDSAANTASPNCPLKYFLLTRNLSLSSLITIFLLTKFMVKVA